MLNRTDISALPTEHRNALLETEQIVMSYVAGLSFIIKNTSRDPTFINNHLLSCLSQDILQSSISIITLTAEGILNVAKRELRFLIEASIKICFVQRESSGLTIENKIRKFDKVLASQRISINKNLVLDLLPERARSDFSEEVGRLYGLSSAYVHLSPQQILERITAYPARSGWPKM